MQRLCTWSGLLVSFHLQLQNSVHCSQILSPLLRRAGEWCVIVFARTEANLWVALYNHVYIYSSVSKCFTAAMAVTLNLSLFLHEWLALFHCPHNHPISVRAVWTDWLCSCGHLWYRDKVDIIIVIGIPRNRFITFEKQIFDHYTDRGGYCWRIVLYTNCSFVGSGLYITIRSACMVVNRDSAVFCKWTFVFY